MYNVLGIYFTSIFLFLFKCFRSLELEWMNERTEGNGLPIMIERCNMKDLSERNASWEGKCGYGVLGFYFYFYFYFNLWMRWVELM